MSLMTAKAEQKSFATSDETREFERGTLDLLRIGGAEIGRLTLQPGWRWSAKLCAGAPVRSRTVEVTISG
jgi:hypothetical protein